VGTVGRCIASGNVLHGLGGQGEVHVQPAGQVLDLAADFLGHGAIVHIAPYAMGAFALCAVLAMLLPRTAVSEEALTGS
jgi:hypothetical protein